MNKKGSFLDRAWQRARAITVTEAAILALLVGGVLGYVVAADGGQRRYEALLNGVNSDVDKLCRDIETWAEANPRGAQMLFDNTSPDMWWMCEEPWERRHGGNTYPTPTPRPLGR